MTFDGKNYHLGIRCFIVIREYATFGMSKTYESDDPFRWVTLHKGMVYSIDDLCKAIGGSYVLKGEYYYVIARRIYTDMLSKLVADVDLKGSSVLRGYLSEANGIYLPERKLQYDQIRERMVNPVRQAHHVVEKFPALRVWGLSTVAEVVVRKTLGSYSCGGVVFDKFAIDT